MTGPEKLTSGQSHQHHESKVEETSEEGSSFSVWGQPWEERAKFLRSQSPYRNFESYRLRPLMVKGGDDLRQELICM